MLDQPLKQGREARYSTVICYKCCWCGGFSRGYAASAINQPRPLKTTLNWKHLQGGVHLTVTPANPALAFLQQIQQRQGEIAQSSKTYSKNQPQFHAPLSPTPSQSALARWTRLKYHQLELHVREDFTHPSPAANNKTYCNTSISNSLLFP